MSSHTRRHPEAQLQRSLVEHLRWCARSDVWWAHIPNGGARTAIEGAIFKALGVQPGAPDLLVIRAGQPIFLELKARGRKLAPTQIECHEALRLKRLLRDHKFCALDIREEHTSAQRSADHLHQEENDDV
jgi:hypothetical protein